MIIVSSVSNTESVACIKGNDTESLAFRANILLPDRIVSFFDPQARPIKKGKLAIGTEFGYKAWIDETESDFVTGYDSFKQRLDKVL